MPSLKQAGSVFCFAVKGLLMTIEDFEEKVWEIDEVRIAVRGPKNTNVGDYDNQNASDKSWRVTEWLEKRIQPKLGELEVIVLGGDGEEPHGRTLLRTLRDSYAKH